MTTPQPIRPEQPPVEDLRNALQIVEMYGDPMVQAPSFPDHALFADIARLIRHALSQLGEPSLEAVQAAEVMIREWEGSLEPRNIRDVAAVILHAAVTGQVPPTWRERELPDPEFPEYICPSCGEPYVSKQRTPEDRLCMQCRYPESDAF